MNMITITKSTLYKSMITDCDTSYFLYGICSVVVCISLGVCFYITYDYFCMNKKSSFRIITEGILDESNYSSQIHNDQYQCICLVCLEPLVDQSVRIPIIECTNCKKYISHLQCFTGWIINNTTCMYCRQ